LSFQWHVFRASLDPVVGREQAGERPVLVVSAEPLNERYDVVMVAPLTSRKRERPARLGEVLLPAGTAGLPMDSFVLCYQVRTLDKSRLGSEYGELTDSALQDQVSFMLVDCFDLYPTETTVPQTED
jgi:mRNA interferase MazF